jgi:hypothetical protein
LTDSWPDKKFYAEGDELVLPTGHIYKRIDGRWKLIRKPDGTEVPQ